MRKRRVYRVEIPGTTTGLYCNSKVWDVKDAMQTTRHPAPDEDAALCNVWADLEQTGKQRYYYFSFATLAQLKSWIHRKDWREILDRMKFRVSVYETVDYYIGDTQAVFRKRDAVKIKELRLTEI